MRRSPSNRWSSFSSIFQHWLKLFFCLQVPYSETFDKTLVFSCFDYDRFSKHDQVRWYRQNIFHMHGHIFENVKGRLITKKYLSLMFENEVERKVQTLLNLPKKLSLYNLSPPYPRLILCISSQFCATFKITSTDGVFFTCYKSEHEPRLYFCKRSIVNLGEAFPDWKHKRK